jgi:uncharacterized protein
MPDALTVVKPIRFDPAATIDASQQTTTTEWYCDPSGRFKSGFWASKPGRADVHYEKDELCVILEGVVRLTDAAGDSQTYRSGDTFLIPSGFKGVWETIEPARKFYAIHRPSED